MEICRFKSHESLIWVTEKHGSVNKKIQFSVIADLEFKLCLVSHANVSEIDSILFIELGSDKTSSEVGSHKAIEL